MPITHLNCLEAVPGIQAGVFTRHLSLSDGVKQVQGHDSVYEMEQPHGKAICTISASTPQYPTLIPTVDASITDQKGAFLAVRTADCLPVLIAHESGVIAGIHAGRKSTELGILTDCLSELKSKTGRDTGYSLYFGPRICPACYEVNPDTGACYDLVAKNKEQLNSSLPKNGYTLELSDHCTSCNTQDFYSFRKEKTVHRFYSYILLTKPTCK